MKIRTRFAPSPTGDLHIGSARTALYCWLYAKHCQGEYILRIEDTDLERSTQASIDAIFDGLNWLGLQADLGPYYQTQRFELYREKALELLAGGKAYRCNCSKERLDVLRQAQMSNGEKPRYDGHCRSTPPKDSTNTVIRFANPDTGNVIINDLILGEITIANSELDDLIILRSDGTPTYNFTVVVDDWDMQVTHVIRGNDHLNNTPRQINLLQAFGANVPQYAHLPMIHGSDGKKLSKRHGATSVMQFRHEGFLPEALLNYLVRLGWSSGDQEIFSIKEMINKFDLTHMNKSPAAFDMNKLLWLNQHYLKNLPLEKTALELRWHFTQHGLDEAQGPALEKIISAFAERCKTLKELTEKAAFLYRDNIKYDANAFAKTMTAEAKSTLQLLAKKFELITSWEEATLHHCINELTHKLNLANMGTIAQPLRVALTGTTVSPPIDITLALLGKEKTLTRINNVLSH